MSEADDRATSTVTPRPPSAPSRRRLGVEVWIVLGGAKDTVPHLVAAFDDAAGSVLGQVAASAKSNEIPAMRTLLGSLDLDGAMVTVDAMHAQAQTAKAITDAGGDYVLTVKPNQPRLYAACRKLPWAHVPAHSTRATPGLRWPILTRKFVHATIARVTTVPTEEDNASQESASRYIGEGGFGNRGRSARLDTCRAGKCCRRDPPSACARRARDACLCNEGPGLSG